MNFSSAQGNKWQSMNKSNWPEVYLQRLLPFLCSFLQCIRLRSVYSLKVHLCNTNQTAIVVATPSCRLQQLLPSYSSWPHAQFLLLKLLWFSPSWQPTDGIHKIWQFRTCLKHDSKKIMNFTWQKRKQPSLPLTFLPRS